jgi:hypothetical protein
MAMDTQQPTASSLSERDLLDVDPCDEALGDSEDERATRYRAFVHSAILVGE